MVSDSKSVIDHCIESQTRVKTNDTLLWTTVLVALQKSRSNDKLILTSVLIVLQKAGLTTHWPRLVCR